MKKFFAALMMFALLMTTSIASAAFEESIEEDADLTAVKKMAIAMPNYYKVEEKEPDLYDLIREIYNAGRMTATIEVISYDDVAAAIRRNTGIDIHSLDVPEAEKVYTQNVSNFADAYLIVTVANNSERPWLFFYVYNAADKKLMYTYSIESKIIGKNSRDYGKAAEAFFKQFDNATVASAKLSNEERKKLKEQKKETRSKKRKMNKVTYKTGKNKAELVRKK